MFQTIPLMLGDIDEKLAVLIVAGMVVFVVLYMVHSIRSYREKREVEQTKREIAAYVAEGSITPDDAVKLLQANVADASASMSMIADGVAWGTISPGKAERLIRAIREDRPKGNEPAPAAS